VRLSLLLWFLRLNYLPSACGLHAPDDRLLERSPLSRFGWRPLALARTSTARKA
jgi:hypothetical protein